MIPSSPPQSTKDRFPYTDLQEYGITQERGFLPAHNPLLSLPQYYRVWDDIGSQLPKLLIAGSVHVRKVISSMPLLDPSGLITTPQVERAMVLLSYIAAAYIWCDADGSAARPTAINVLPACIAVPWYQISKRLGRVPALHFATIVQNWRLIDESKPIELGNVVMNQNFYGGIDEEWFFLIPIAIEAKGGGIIEAIVSAQRSVDANYRQGVTVSLIALSNYLSDITNILHQMRERCHPTVFFVRLRPFLHGWSNLPTGLIYEGVEELNNEPQKYAGGSAAQTPLIQVIDAALQISQNQPFLKEMRKYMQPQHVQFLTEVEDASTIREYVENNSDCIQLVLAFNKCVEIMAEFRSYHIQLAASYILSQTHAARGTGGSSFVDFLKKVRDTTLTHRVNILNM